MRNYYESRSVKSLFLLVWLMSVITVVLINWAPGLEDFNNLINLVLGAIFGVGNIIVVQWIMLRRFTKRHILTDIRTQSVFFNFLASLYYICILWILFSKITDMSLDIIMIWCPFLLIELLGTNTYFAKDYIYNLRGIVNARLFCPSDAH